MLTPLGYGRIGGGAKLLKTGQTTCYMFGDDGDTEKGVAKSYTVNSTGAQSGTTNIDSPGYAGNTIAFDGAAGTITDSAAGLAVFKTGDVIRVRGSASNDNVFTIDTGGVAGTIQISRVVPNSGFETAGALPPVFLNWVQALGDGTLVDEGVLVHSGSHAAKMTAGASANTAMRSGNISVTPGYSYTISFWTRGDGTYSGRYGIKDVTHSTWIIADLTPTNITNTVYALFTNTFTAPAGCIAVQIWFECPSTNGGIAYFDDVYLTLVSNPALVTEAAGAYITICKREAHSNNTVFDVNTGLTWSRYASASVGPASDGKLNWYNAATCYTLHPAAADVAMVVGNILRVVGSDESARYYAGQPLVCSGFVNDTPNNKPGLVVVSVSFTGGNTDIVVDPGEQTLIAEAAGGSRDIKVICQSIFGYAAAANAASLAEYTDWRVPDRFEYTSLMSHGVWGPCIDTVSFPSFPSVSLWSTNTRIRTVTQALSIDFSENTVSNASAKTVTFQVLLVRGG